MHGGGGQPGTSRLLSCACIAAEVWDDYWFSSWVPVGVKRGREWGETLEAAINGCEYVWVKGAEICKGSLETAGSQFLQWRKLLGLSAEQVTVNCHRSCCGATTGSSCFSSLFIIVSTCLSFVSFDGVKLKQDLCMVPGKSG